jgi:3-hydroxyacyl-CoA dehydrogenase/enoyl-CoA hydratase/3-hydroxybutyryl-CoA epimerase
VVDDVVPAPVLLAAARTAALALADGGLGKPRGGIPRRSGCCGRSSSARRAVRLEKTGGHYPAPLQALDAVQRGTALPLPEGLKIEARHFGELSVSDVSRALVSVFFATQDIKKDAGYPQGTQAREVRKLGVLGAGLMGRGHRHRGRGCRRARADQGRKPRGPGPRPAPRARGSTTSGGSARA